MATLPPNTFLVLGSGTFGVGPDKAEAFRMLDYVQERSACVIDTARCYPPTNQGMSESIIGAWLKARNCSDSFWVATKGGHPPMNQLDQPRLSAEELSQDIEQSRQALGVDCIDLYWLHRDDKTRSLNELLETLESFKARGWIRQYGASNFSVERLKSAAAIAQENGWEGFSANQPMACLGGQYRKPIEIPLLVTLEDDTERYHRETGLPLFPYTSQATGYYEKVHRLGVTHPSLSQNPFNTPECNQIAEQLITLSTESGHSISALTLAWWKSKKYPAYPLLGCRTFAQLEASFKALDVDPETIEQLARIAPKG